MVLGKKQLLATASALGFAWSGSAATAQDVSYDRWQWSAELYAWGADIGGTTRGGRGVELSFGDILDNLNFTLMGTIFARRGDTVFFFDGVYLDIGNSGTGEGRIDGVDIAASGSVDLESFISTFGGGYTFSRNGNTAWTGLIGARYLNMETRIRASVGDAPRGGIDINRSDDIWDAVIGIQGETELSDRWALTYYADVGGGGSDFTWQAKLGAQYRYDWGALTFGYRHLDFDFDSDTPITELDVSGPFVGVRFNF